MGQKIQIIRARPEQAAELTEIAFKAKASWGYPAAWLESWRESLTITPRFVADHEVFVAVSERGCDGFSAIAQADASMELVHLWVLPEAMRTGVGRALFERAAERVRELGFKQLLIESDPNAEPFYLRMGARRTGRSVIHSALGVRELPLLTFP